MPAPPTTQVPLCGANKECFSLRAVGLCLKLQRCCSSVLPLISCMPCAAGVLPELLPLANLLSAEPEWQRDAAGVASLAMSCLANIAAAYLRRGDAVSAAVLLEASLRT